MKVGKILVLAAMCGVLLFVLASPRLLEWKAENPRFGTERDGWREALGGVNSPLTKTYFFPGEEGRYRLFFRGGGEEVVGAEFSEDGTPLVIMAVEGGSVVAILWRRADFSPGEAVNATFQTGRLLNALLLQQKGMKGLLFN